ncbi:MAG TPA: SRPBCC domain-containing protein [Candidatus Limnocylindrales bacterium]|nr:SRPBCC domain-containing protein [Candidatus Limnocylindrales bacterium]
MRKITTSVDIEAVPERVWAALTSFDYYPDWNPFIRQASGRLQVGETLTLRMFPAKGRPMTFRPKVLVVEPQRELRWLGRLAVPGIFDGEHSFRLTPIEGGATRMVQAERFSGALVPFVRGLVDRTVNDFHRLNEALKRYVEADTRWR